MWKNKLNRKRTCTTCRHFEEFGGDPMCMDGRDDRCIDYYNEACEWYHEARCEYVVTIEDMSDGEVIDKRYSHTLDDARCTYLDRVNVQILTSGLDGFTVRLKSWNYRKDDYETVLSSSAFKE